MYELDFNKKEHIHFIGIGGISMSALAEILHNRGFKITGSDIKESPLTKHLEKLGIKVIIGQNAENIDESIDLVVYTAAVHPENPEYAEALRRNIPAIKRAAMLGQIMRNFKNPIAIAGTHGKTTTTSMCSQIMLAADLDPTITVGGILPAIDGNIRIGHSDTFITEACEYTNSFLELFPKIAVILNVDADHLDFFKDIDDIARSFHKFAALVPADGTLVMYKDSAKYDTVTEGLKCKIVTFGEKDNADYYPANIEYDENGFPTFTCMSHGRELGRIKLEVPGYHNIMNALATLAVCLEYKVPMDTVIKGFELFHGTDRRFEKKGEINGVTVYDDYAHHPSEIRATLTAAKKLNCHSLWVVFQPHTYTRTKALLPEFAKALTLADHVVLADIYAAREKNTIGISSADLCDAIRSLGGDAKYFPSFGEIEDYLLENVVDKDIVITMGAGDVFKVGEELLGLS